MKEHELEDTELYATLNRIEYEAPQIATDTTEEAPSVVVIDLQSTENCVFHTMKYMATGEKIATTDEMLREKEKVLEMARMVRNNKYAPEYADMFKYMSMNTTPYMLSDDQEENKRYLSENTHKLDTIVLYSRVLNVNVIAYFEETWVKCIHDESYRTISLYVSHVPLWWIDDKGAHMFGIVEETHQQEYAAIVAVPHERVRMEGWGFTGGVRGAAYKVMWRKGTAQKAIDKVNNRTRNRKPEELNTLGNLKIGMYRAVTASTNSAREEIGQSRLVNSTRADPDLQGHDPGSFGRAKVIFDITNSLKDEIGQTRLTSSTSAADVNMHQLQLHEEDDLRLFKTQVYEEQRAKLNAKNEIEGTTQSGRVSNDTPDCIFIHRTVTQQSEEELTLLSDSGATRTVIGKGSAANRALNDYAVLHNGNKRGWAHPDSMNVKIPQEMGRGTKDIVVASGEMVKATSLAQVQLGVEGEILRNGKWTDKQTIFITCGDAAVSEKIQTTVWSETHFMEHNPGWTMIMHEKEKYMIYGNIGMCISSIGKQAPIKVNLRYKDGAHYLDAVTAVVDNTMVKGKGGSIINVTEQKSESEQAETVRVNMVSVNDSNNETEDTEEYVEVVDQNEIRTESRPMDNRPGREYRWPRTMTIEECRIKMMEIMRDEQAELWEKVEAIEEFDRRTDEMNQVKNMYMTRRAELLQLHAMQTRRQRQQDTVTEPTSDTNVTAGDKQVEKEETVVAEKETENGHEQEYEVIFRAEQERRKQVRFEDKVMYEPSSVDKRTDERKESVSEAEVGNGVGTKRVLRETRVAPIVKGAGLKEAKERTRSEVEMKADVTDAEQTDACKKEKQNKEIDVYEHYDLYSEPAFKGNTPNNVEIYQDDKFKKEAKIDEVSDFTLAQFLMENKVKL